MNIIQYLGSVGIAGAEAVIKNYSVELISKGHEIHIRHSIKS